MQLRIKVKYKTKADAIEYLSFLVERLKDEVYYPPLPMESNDPFRIDFGNRGKRIWLTCEKKGKKRNMIPLKIKLLDPACRPTRSGNWIDCYSREEIHYEAGECKRIPLGFCVSVGKGKEMLLTARSSFFGKTGGIQTNAPGVIDEEYCGDEDEVLFSVYFTRPGMIYKGQKIAQFRIIDKMPEVKFEYVEKMNAPSRGGFGSTGN